jgi:hypothetical protein
LAGESEAKVGESDLAKSLNLLAKVKSESGESTMAKSLKSLSAEAKKSPLYKYNPRRVSAAAGFQRIARNG